MLILFVIMLYKSFAVYCRNLTDYYKSIVSPTNF